MFAIINLGDAMEVKKINKTNSGKYKLTLDNDSKILTYDDVIIKNNLLYDKQIDDEKLKLINKDNEYYEVYNKLIKYIYTKLRSEKEVKNYISKFNLEKDKEIEIVSKLKEIGFIDDYKFVKAFIGDKLNLSNVGPYKILKELKEHDIDETLIEEELSKIDSDFLESKILKITKKKVALNKKYSNYNLKQKLLMEFYNLGYDKNMVEDIIDNSLSKSDDILIKAYDSLYLKLSKKYSGAELKRKIKEKLYQKGFDINEINEIINKENNA